VGFVGAGELGEGYDLVVLALPGVQRFITEARSTADVAGASGIYSRLAREIVGSLSREPGAEIVLPDSAVVSSPDTAGPAGASEPGERTERGMPNRVAVLLPAGSGAAAAGRAVAAASAAWESWLRGVWRLPDGALVPATPGFPVTQWACVPAAPGGYPEQWRLAQRLLAARRRVRDFPPVPEAGWERRELCSLAPRWPAERVRPPRIPPHEATTRLSAVGWVKRRWAALHDEDGFPSTASIASAPYRKAILERLHDAEVRRALANLADAARVLGSARETPVPGLTELIPADGPGRWLAERGGPWVYEDRWEPALMQRETGPRPGLAEIAAAGRTAARRLREVMAQASVPGYLAVVVQDLDGMGRFLGGHAGDGARRRIIVSPGAHRRVSAELLDVAAAQRATLRSADLLGVPVYLGGDDLLTFTPARSALDAAQACHDAIPLSLPRASTAVLYFHYHASIQAAMSQARVMLDEAKRRVPGKHGLAVGYLRRSGASALSVQRWLLERGGRETSIGHFGLFARGADHRLSPRLVADLQRDAGELAALAQVRDELYLAELTRLVRRHTDGGGGAAEAAQALRWLGEHEYAATDVPGPHLAAQVGVFLRQEAR
jgi:CRISPR-associated protein Cmr2